MITPFNSHQLFDLNDDLTIHYDKQSRVLFIDNFYKNYCEITTTLNNFAVDKWKGRSPDTRNYIDYFDCRLVLGMYNNLKPDDIEQKYIKLFNAIEECLNVNVDNSRPESSLYHVQFFRHIKTPDSPNVNFVPHIDPNTINLIVYLDNHCAGGTSFYESYPDIVQEESNVMIDVCKYKPKFAVNAKPNQAVIFDGNRPHGGYINNHDIYTQHWRTSNVMFIPFSYK